jgi:hypothetical protein
VLEDACMLMLHIWTLLDDTITTTNDTNLDTKVDGENFENWLPNTAVGLTSAGLVGIRLSSLTTLRGCD